MEIVTSVFAMQAKRPHPDRRRVLVPTMGALHRGHLELIKLARAVAGDDGEVAASIFVNPLQFEPGSDFERYPRPENLDEELCRAAGVDLLFRPDVGEMYFPDRSVQVDEAVLSQALCGKSRPGHFEGVCTVVAKLFHIVAPAAAVFGEKDFQQLAIIRRMVRDLDFALEVIGAPTVRETDGLACSSRNQYLSAEERAQAPVLWAALLAAAAAFRGGETSAERLISGIRQRIADASVARIDYLEAVDAETLQAHETANANTLLAVAVYFGRTRLIDNLRLG